MPTTRDAVRQYLERYAEPEAQLAPQITARYEHVLVVPAYAEAATLLGGFDAAARAAHGKVLVILVVNTPEDAPPDARLATETLWSQIAELPGRELAPNARLASAESFELLALDRCTGGRALPRRQAVGLARRAGMDLALSLWHAGKLGCHWFGSSDADVELSADYFQVLAAQARERAPGTCGALLLPFSHTPGGDAELDRATWLYEAGLRYYVLGLAFAGSPYAYHSIGSCFAVDALSYARVRGFPKRAAGEDFYLLDKLAKVAPLVRSRLGRVQIRARRSERVPFGTGRRASEIVASGEPLAYHPDLFLALGAFLHGLEAFARDGDPSHVAGELRARTPDLADAALNVLGPELAAALSEAKAQAAPGAALRRRIHTWFDALRTLQLIHDLRDAARPSLPLGAALALADFVAPASGGPQLLEPRRLCESLEALEQTLSRWVGPSASGLG